MGKIYVAAFLLPSPVEKHLTEYGWEFDSPERLPELAIDVLKSSFDLTHTESFLGADVWEGKGLKAVALRDAAGRVEEVFVQLFRRQAEELRGALQASGLDSIEVFVPVG